MKILGFFIRLPGSNRALALGWLGRRPPAFFSPSASLSLPLRPVFLVAFVCIEKSHLYLSLIIFHRQLQKLDFVAPPSSPTSFCFCFFQINTHPLAVVPSLHWTGCTHPSSRVTMLLEYQCRLAQYFRPDQKVLRREKKANLSLVELSFLMQCTNCFYHGLAGLCQYSVSPLALGSGGIDNSGCSFALTIRATMSRSWNSCVRMQRPTALPANSCLSRVAR